MFSNRRTISAGRHCNIIREIFVICINTLFAISLAFRATVIGLTLVVASFVTAKVAGASLGAALPAAVGTLAVFTGCVAGFLASLTIHEFAVFLMACTSRRALPSSGLFNAVYIRIVFSNFCTVFRLLDAVLFQRLN